MSWNSTTVVCRSDVVVAAVLLLGATASRAQQIDLSEAKPSGRIDFALADLPPATIEIDLSEEIFSDLFGLGEAALAGVVEALTQSNATNGSEATHLAAEKLDAAHQILQLAKEVVREVRVRVYEDYPEETGSAVKLDARFDQQLSDGQWDNVVKVREGNDGVNASFLRVEGSILGIFVVVSDGKDVVLANIVCDVSPENVKKLASAATKIGLENGLQKVLEHELQHLR